MHSFSNTLKQLPPDSRNRVVNWVASQDWSGEKADKPEVDPRQATLGLS
jgi:hypothetical protein